MKRFVMGIVCVVALATSACGHEMDGSLPSSEEVATTEQGMSWMDSFRYWYAVCREAGGSVESCMAYAKRKANQEVPSAE